MDTSSKKKLLLAEISQLRKEVEHLQQRNLDLEISLSTISEHGDFIEAQLQNEVTERQRTENSLSKLLNLISREKDDLEIVLQTLTEHGDAVDSHWHHKLDEAVETANRDSLTQIANRRRFDEHLEQQWKQMAREQEFLSIVLCDIDFFKQYNDTYGHLEGDQCLKQVAQALNKAVLRPIDLAARYGGEEFVAVLPKTNLDGAIQVAQHIQLAIAQLQIPHTRSTVSAHVTLSIGVACTVPAPGADPVHLLNEADQFLYKAKQKGRNQMMSAAASTFPLALECASSCND